MPFGIETTQYQALFTDAGVFDEARRETTQQISKGYAGRGV
jgi:hypothetical protein